MYLLLVGGLGRRASDGGANVQTYYKRQVIPGQQGQSPNQERPTTVRYFHDYLNIYCDFL